MKKRTKTLKEKFCNKCGKTKPAKDFGKRGGFAAKLLNAFCKMCRVKIATLWRIKNKEKYNKYQKNYRHKQIKNG